ncbi:hypothetical protein ACWCPX_46405 [Streptomyces olivaceoviridis]
MHHGEDIIWRFNDETSSKLNGATQRHIRDTLLDMRSFHTTASLLAADWKQVPDLLGTLRIALPEDPDKDQAQDAAPAAQHPAGCMHCADRDGRPHGACTHKKPCATCVADGMKPVG